MDYKYDVALSFAGEDREYIERFAEILKEAGISVFYDKFEEIDLWGKDLAIHFDYVYRRQSKYFIPFISKNYAEKVWTNYEVRTAFARSIENKDEEYILPVKLDDTELDGLRSTIASLDARTHSPEELANKFLKKLGSEVSVPTPQKDEPEGNVYLSTYLEVSELYGLTGINIGVIVTNFIKEDRFFGPPIFKISQPIIGTNDTFQLVNPSPNFEFPKKLVYGEQYSVQYSLSKGFLDTMKNLEGKNVTLTAFASTTVGEKYVSNPMEIDDLFKFKK